MWTCAPVLSVQLMASTDPRSTSARRQVTSGSALLLEESSAVTTKRPARNTSAKRLGVGMGLLSFWRNAIPTVDQVDPRRAALQLQIDRFLQIVDVIFKGRQS